MLRTISPPNVPTGLPSAAEISGVLDRLDRFFNGEKAIRQFFAGFKSVLEEYELDLRKFGTLENIEAQQRSIAEVAVKTEEKRLETERILTEAKNTAARIVGDAKIINDKVAADLAASAAEASQRNQRMIDNLAEREKLVSVRELDNRQLTAALDSRAVSVAAREAAVNERIRIMLAAGIKIEL